MTLKISLLTSAALSAFALSAGAQAMPDNAPMIPGMVPGTLPGMVRMADGAMPVADPMSPAPNGAMMQQPMAQPSMMAMQPGMMAAQDKLFGARDAEGNFAELTFASLALNKSKTPGVRQVAQTIISGHTVAQNDLMMIMKSKGMMMAPMLSATHMAVYDALKKAKGDKFDMMYMAGQVGDHENTIALYQTEVANGMDDALKEHANKFLPDIVGHTILIYNVARQVKAPGIEMRPMLPPVPPGVTPAIMGKPLDMTDMTAMMNSLNNMTMMPGTMKR